jgi:hypothetical protein
MANTQFSSSSTSTVKLWSERTLYDFVSDTEMLGQMIKAGVLNRQDNTSNNAGDRVTTSWLQRQTQKGLLGSAVATGNESPMVYYTDDLLINQIRCPVNIPAPFTIDTQRVTYDLPEDAYRTMSEWMKVRGILGAFNQLAGNTATTITYDGETYSGNDRLLITGLNSDVAPSTASGVTRIIRPNSLTTDQAVAADTTATMKLSFILNAETIAQTSRPYIRPLSETSEVKYHLYCHTEQYNQLLQDTTSPFQYRDINQALITSGRGQGELQRSFIFSQTRVFNSDKLPLGVDSGTSAAVANCRRAIFCGRDAGAIAFGKGYSDGRESVAGFRINSDFYDIGQTQRLAMVGIFGIKKLQYNSTDNGVIVISTYSAI